MNPRLFVSLALLISLSNLSVSHLSAQGQPPAAPSNLQATVSSATEILLTWADNSTDETGFVIYENGQFIATVATDVTSIIIGNLAPNSSHCYVVNAYNGIGNSDFSNESCATLTPPMQLPAAPTNLQVTVVNNTQIRLDWIDNSDDETGFHIFESFSIIATVGSNITSTIMGNLEPREYCFLVTAYNGVGDSYPTNMACAQIVNTYWLISGWVRGENGIPLSNVVISSSNGIVTSTVNDGSYLLGDQEPGTYTITPSKSGWTFVPSFLMVTIPPDATEVNFTAIPIEPPTAIPTSTYTKSPMPPTLPTATWTRKPATSTSNFIWTSTPTWTATPSPTPSSFSTGSPSRTPSRTPTATTLSTSTPSIGSVEGMVTDGHGHPLIGVEVLLLQDIDGISTTLRDPTSTDQMGHYIFTNIPINNPGYRIGIRLQTKIGQDYRRRILWGTSGLLVSVRTEPFQLKPYETLPIYVDFGKADSVDSDPIPKDKLDDLAAIYYHLTEVEDFVKQDLGESTFTPVSGLWAYATSDTVGSEGAFYCTSKYMDCMPETIYMGQGISDYELPKNNFYRPMNREWHESYHYVMDSLGLWPFQPGLKGDPHDGIKNDTSYGSWTEGWADFFPTVMLDGNKLSETEGYPNSPYYQIGGPIPVSFEYNWKSWDLKYTYAGNLKFVPAREEFAVSSLLWDFYDAKDVTDTDLISPVPSLSEPWDNVDLSLADLWQITTARPYLNIRDLYENGFLQAAQKTLVNKEGTFVFPDGLENEKDGEPVTEDDVKMLFILHGFFGDKNENRILDNDELDWIGYAGWKDGQPRKNTPPIPNAYVKISVLDDQGNPIDHASMKVDINYENPYFNYSSQWELPQATDNLIYLELPPTRTKASAKFTVTYNGKTSAEYVIDNAKYWDKVQHATNGYAEEFTLVIDTKDRGEIGIILLMILLFSGVALILIFAAQKRKALRKQSSRQPKVSHKNTPRWPYR